MNFQSGRWRALIVLVTAMLVMAGCAFFSSTSTPTPTPTPEPTLQPASHGAAGLGDPVFPQAGNGGYDAQHYLLDLQVDVEENVLTATVTMTAQTTQALNTFNLDFAGFTIDNIAVNSQPATYERREREVTIRPSQVLAAGEPFTTQVSYHGTPEAGGAWHHREGAVFVTGEPIGAATWYPVNNHPLDKATYTFRVSTSQPYVAVANGTLVDTVEDEDTNTYVWEMDRPMASYLSTIYVADLTAHSGDAVAGLSIQNYIPRGLAPEADGLFASQDEMLAFFATQFGPYPFETYGAALVDAAWGGALETQSLSLFGRSALLMDMPANVELPIEVSPQTVIAHELAHQWFGDSVSLESWQDVWLKEGLATYASWLWWEHVDGEGVLGGIVERRYAAVAGAIDGAMFTFSENPTPFDGFSGQEAMEVLSSIDPEALRDQQKLADALPLDELSKEGEGTSAATDNLSNAHIAQMIDVLPEGDLSGERVLEILETLPTDDMSGRQVYHALVVLQIYNVAGMSIFQGSRIAAPGTPPADNLYNISVYDRGALTLHALRLKVGDEVFFDILRTYYDRYKTGNAGTADFIEVAEEISEQDLGAFFDAWLYEERMPAIPEMGLPAADPESPAATPRPDADSSRERTYTTEEVSFENGDVRLAGTLTLPPAPGPHPALVMITGSGPQDRDNANTELIPGYRPYRDIAEQLARHGVATLRYDDRGVGESTGDATTTTPPELATDVEAALAYLRDRPEVKAEQIGLLGHSQGGLVAGMVAAGNPQVNFVVMLAGQTVDMPTLQAATLKRHAAAAGQAEMGVRMAEQAIQTAELARAEKWDALEEYLYQSYMEQLRSASSGTEIDEQAVEQKVRELVDQAVEEYTSPSYLFNARYDPSEDWSQVTVPVLALYAEHDYNVPADLNGPALEEALATAGNEDVTIETVSGVNHLFLDADDADPANWGAESTAVPSDVLNRITTWLLEHVKITSSINEQVHER